LWFATDEGVCWFDGLNFHPVDMGPQMKGEAVRTIVEDKGTLLLGSDKGIAFIDRDQKIIDQRLAKNVFQGFIDSTIRVLLAYDKSILVATDSGLYVYATGKIQAGFQNLLIDFAVTELFVDSGNRLWIGGRNAIYSVNPGVANKLEKWSVKNGLVEGRIRSIAEDKYGNLWVCTSRGISIFDGESFININSENGLATDRLRCLYVDRSQNIWVGTQVAGIMRYNYKDFTGFTTREGLASNQVQSIYEDEYGDMLVGTTGGFSHLEVADNKLYNYSTIKLASGFAGNSVRSIYYDAAGFTWLGTSTGITLVRADERIDIVIDSTMPTTVSAIRFFDDRFWIGTNTGVYNITVGGNYEHFEIRRRTEVDSASGTAVSAIIKDPANRVWVSFSDGSAGFFKNDKWITPLLPGNTNYIISMAADSTGRLWFGTAGNGIFYGYYNDASNKCDLRNLSLTENLSSNYFYSILINKKDVWLGHEKGIDILFGGVDSIQSIVHCGVETGFKGLQNYPNASYRDSRGNLWFGTIDGLYRLNGRELDSFASGRSAVTYIQALKVDGQVIDWSSSEWCSSTDGLYHLPVGLVLPYFKNNVEFEFASLNFVAPEKVTYSWMLEGYDAGWHAPSPHNHIRYTNLGHGDYVFRLRASNDLGIIQDDEISFSFTIDKPFWHTWWFRICAGIFVIAMMILIIRWRTVALRNKQKALERIIVERTSEINQKNEVLEEKNKEIIDSIFYSRRIQRSMLPAKEKVAKLIDDYFIFFRPKDIVSGDFYWAEKSLDRTKTLFAVADCTGHGVPGAMVSLIGTRALNSAVRESGATKTSEILDLVNEIMIESFTDSSQGIIKDGMDIALCALDYTRDPVVGFQYAGAQNSAWIVRPEREDNLVVNGERLEPNAVHAGYKLFELKPDKQPIGYFEGRKPFTNKDAILKKGDRIYLYSDGFADQFGGEKGKKFKYKTLKTLVLSVQSIPMRDQYPMVRTAFYNWKREFEQIDDVCFMGVEV
jgi:ligand-binding sensor domain-containing protein